MRVVLDTNILVSACLNIAGAPATIIGKALSAVFTFYVSPEVLAEYREVLARQKFSLHQKRISLLLAGLEEIAITITPKHTLSISPDEEDNRLLECAETAKADFLVTGNLKHFPASIRGTRIVSAREFLAELQC